MGSPTRTCGVCGRTILAGEHVRGYVSEAGPRTVCELCVGRAERLGWLTEEELERPGAAGRSPARGRRRLSGFLRRRRPQAEPQLAEVDFEPEVDEPDGLDEPAGADPSLPEPRTLDTRPFAPNPDPAAPGQRPSAPAPDAFGPSPFERAVARFNASEAGRTVLGLTRTLGRPWVSVGAMAGAPSEIRITVAWELSWYQWGVDLGDELRPVFQIDKGQEIAQIDAAAQQWNASTDEEGRVVISAPAGAGAGPR